MDPVVFRAIAVGLGLAFLLLLSRWWRARDGAVRQGSGAAIGRDDLRALGLDLRGVSAGAVLLGSPTCSPCAQVERVLGELGSDRRAFRWVYADAADHPALTERHRVMRVPTLLIVDADGRLVGRASGIPDVGALRRMLDGAPGPSRR